jgi:hypothetical protein
MATLTYVLYKICHYKIDDNKKAILLIIILLLHYIKKMHKIKL